jgi:DNA-binding PadR family transcriptional regulator
MRIAYTAFRILDHERHAMTRQPSAPNDLLPLKPRVYMTLLLLAERPRHGYDLLGALEEHSGGALRLNAGSFYRLIHRLAEDGLVERVASDDEGDAGGGERKVYGLTDLGLETLRAEVRRQEGLLVLARKWAG